MKNLASAVLFLTTTFLAAPSFAGSIIVHPGNTSTLSTEEIARAFLGKIKEFPSGETVVPVALAEGDASTAKFVADVLKKSPSQLKSYWAKLVFTGQGEPPVVIASEQELIAKVAANPGMIGYVSDAAPQGVKVIASF